jgi:hypothetical protein
MNANSQFLQSTCDRFWVTFITSCQSAHTIFFRFRLSQTSFLCSRLRDVVSIFHEISIVHQFSKSFSIFIVQITNCRFSNNIKLGYWYSDTTLVILTSFSGYLGTILRLDWHLLVESSKNPFACLHSGNENGFFIWIEWERLFHLGWMRTAFSSGLNEDGFFIWVKWKRLFIWVNENGFLSEDGFFGWVEWGRLFYLGWMGTTFSTGLNEDGFFWSTQVGDRRRWMVGAAEW